jgi:hypothetical protein
MSGLVVISCHHPKSDFLDFLKKNNQNHFIDTDFWDDDCFKSKFISREELKSKIFIIDNKEDCPGQRFLSSKNNFDFFIDKNDDFNLNSNVSLFKSHLVNSILVDDNFSMEVYLYTNLSENDIDKINLFIFELLRAFYETKSSQKFIPLNVFVVVNADDMIEAWKKIPENTLPIIFHP